eukprot:TRINITY_DN2677_c1_g1_i1.p2 TRINITY_DN2677_c1_g1~~TRINITY_DN2677_c1_g1_i1.p2  ORF type:complete len:177 (+),score=15.00 TRINITY_DN2677_c1_g1_i1:187-717(+)
MQHKQRVYLCQSIKYSDLRLWQLKKLELAYQKGKKHREVNSLSKELGFDRAEVIEWFKTYDEMPQERRDAMRSTLEASQNAKRRRQGILKGENVTKKQKKKQNEQDKPTAWQDVNDIRRGVRRDRIPKDAVRTMEKIFLKYRHPSDDIVSEIQKLHQLRRKQVLDWFAQQRREVQK